MDASHGRPMVKVYGLWWLNLSIQETESGQSSIKLDGQNDLNWIVCECGRAGNQKLRAQKTNLGWSEGTKLDSQRGKNELGPK